MFTCVNHAVKPSNYLAQPKATKAASYDVYENGLEVPNA